ncbi:MAG: nitroreductase [Candidatus Muproteobacteria bacterium RBG_16_64_11]|uniref:Nitroreductase n=1 Tax=Candidatus Muproteobacteria bacterium RBG_16_64_11 TaxID=1817758 RepID=A0A1F6TCF8_9PROT|nr:MAG: nitroreductase [Candidatus Muproteobacteria bacterium RBG_16_64_11]
MQQKPAATSVPIHELLARRWSPRAIDPARPLARGQLVALLEAARWAPSCFNDQPWRYLVWDRFRDAAAWQRAFQCLTPGNQGWVRNAPVLLLAAAGDTFGHNAKPNRWGPYDTGAASENLCLQAAALGLVAHQRGGFGADAIRAAFAIPASYTCQAMIAVGHPGPIELLNEEKQKSERAPRTRRALGESFFEAAWGTPVTTD